MTLPYETINSYILNENIFRIRCGHSFYQISQKHKNYEYIEPIIIREIASTIEKAFNIQVNCNKLNRTTYKLTTIDEDKVILIGQVTFTHNTFTFKQYDKIIWQQI